MAEWNPISAVTMAPRELFGDAGVPEDAGRSMAHSVAGTLGWCAVLLALGVPAEVRRYAREMRG